MFRFRLFVFVAFFVHAFCFFFLYFILFSIVVWAWSDFSHLIDCLRSTDGLASNPKFSVQTQARNRQVCVAPAIMHEFEEIDRSQPKRAFLSLIQFYHHHSYAIPELLRIVKKFWRENVNLNFKTLHVRLKSIKVWWNVRTEAKVLSFEVGVQIARRRSLHWATTFGIYVIFGVLMGHSLSFRCLILCSSTCCIHCAFRCPFLSLFLLHLLNANWIPNGFVCWIILWAMSTFWWNSMPISLSFATQPTSLSHCWHSFDLSSTIMLHFRQ